MVCVLEQGWNKTLQGCGPPGTEFDTPGLKEYHAWLPPHPQVFWGQCEHDSCFLTLWTHQTTCLKLLNIALARQCQSTSLHALIQNSQTLVWPQASIANVKKNSVSNRAHYSGLFSSTATLPISYPSVLKYCKNPFGYVSVTKFFQQL